MAIEFKVHVTDTNWSASTTISNDAKYYLSNTSQEIDEGFKPNTAAHSAAVNAILHETSLVITAFASFLNDDTGISIDPSTTLANIKTAIGTRLTNYIGAATAKNVGYKFKYTLNGGTQQEYDGSAEKTLSFYAPTAAGTANQLLISGGANTAPTWYTASLGGLTEPVYVNTGVLAKCTKYAAGTRVTLNGTTKAADVQNQDGTASFFAPTTSVAADKYKVLVSNGADAPVWSHIYVKNGTSEDYLFSSLGKIHIYNDDAGMNCGLEVSGKTICASSNAADDSNGPALDVKGGAKIGANLANNADIAINVNDTFTVTKAGNITAVGNVTSSGLITAVSFNSTSDLRLKENVVDFVPQKSILDLPIKEFDYKRDGSHHIGCIAQDLQKICPEIVHEDSEGYLNIEESKLIYLLINEVKELKKEIELLKKGAK